MHIVIEPRRAPAGADLIEVVTPRTNAATIAAAENLFAANALSEPFSLEIAATGTARWFVARAAGPRMLSHLRGQLAVAYPQAEMRSLDIRQYPGLDPSRLGPDEQVAACALVLEGPEYLPIRIFGDAEVEDARVSQSDPILGILGALGDLPDGWRSLAQLVLRPAPRTWCKSYLRLAMEAPFAAERGQGQADSSLASVYLLAGALAAGVLAFQGYHWYATRDWLHLGLLGAGVIAALPGLFWMARRLTDRPVYDPLLVREKVSRLAYVGQIRLAIFAPTDVPALEVEARLERLGAAYRQYSLASANSLDVRPLRLRGRDLCELGPLPGGRPSVLNTRELAGLWHLPQATADVPFIERTTARQRTPLPSTVARGCPIGVSGSQGRPVPVAISPETLARNLLLVAKTRRGKSTLMLQLARYLMETRSASGRPPALVLVDPHADLAQALLGLVPAGRRGDVVYLNVDERARPFGLNLLDVGLFQDRDKAVVNALDIFRREFDRFWGPRMEDAFRFALLTLYEINQTICAADPDGRSRQHTILDVPSLLIDTGFRRPLLSSVADPVVASWWTNYFDTFDRKMQLEIANPVETKVQRFTGSRAARVIVGQPRSTIDPSAWVRSGAIVIVNTGQGAIGAETAGLVGSTLLNLVALQVGEQSKQDPEARCPVTLLVDEFHTMPGADYEGILGQLGKYGANLVLATQSLTRLDTLDKQQERALRATVFANLDGLFAFNVSAEDAGYLVHELGPEVDEEDLVSVGEHQCYARLSARGERLPTFSVRLSPPPASNPAVARQIAAASAALYGRDVGAVERDLRSALARIAQSHRALMEASQEGNGVARGAPTGGRAEVGAAPGTRKPPRNEKRNQRPRSGQPYQATLPDVGPIGASGESASPPPRGERR